jgi:peroxiredoxin
MPNRLPVAVGVATGILVAAVVIGGIIAFAPEPTAARPSPSETAPPSAAPSGDASPSPDGESAAPSASSGPIVTDFHIGEPAPSLVVPQVGGGTIDLASLKGSPVWVNFMDTRCPECVDDFRGMNGFAVRYADAGLVVLAIDVREDEGTVAAFAQSLDATFPLGLDLDGAAQRAWEAFALPIHFWVDAEGVIRDGSLGGIGPDIMARGVARIMPGVEVTP